MRFSVEMTRKAHLESAKFISIIYYAELEKRLEK